MRSVFAVATLVATSLSAPAFAQGTGDALFDARVRDACDGYEVERARYEYEPELRLIVSCGEALLPLIPGAAGAGVAGAAGAAGAGAAAAGAGVAGIGAGAAAVGAVATNLALIAPIAAGVAGVAAIGAAAGGTSTTPDTQ